MSDKKKLKKWGTKSRHHAERAEAAADRAEAALRRIAEIAGTALPEGSTSSAESADAEHHSPVYTSPRGQDDTPPAAAVP